MGYIRVAFLSGSQLEKRYPCGRGCSVGKLGIVKEGCATLCDLKEREEGVKNEYPVFSTCV